MYKGQVVYMHKPDNLPTGGQEVERKRVRSLSKGTIVGVYPHIITVQFDNYKSSYRIDDIMLGLEYYREVN
jgi:hypothetical protein